MEIREFAERVLFSSDLEEKLRAPESALTDDCPGHALKTSTDPGRPAGLGLAATGSKGPRPRRDFLPTEKERGVLLHFFANHELLAAELMALALLKFPHAPTEFRLGLAATLREEQIHTQWYLRRLKECGGTFGEHPLNGYFWRSISTMAEPIDYVSRLSLTFEQANLDYARHFGKLFAEAGDSATARILDRIYRDEISHVNYGLTWFRRWKDPQQTDWDAYRQRLIFPLSPARAKGTTGFNAEGRSLAGLDDCFIRELRLFSQSRGRTPWVYLFNPGAEACAIADDPQAWKLDKASRLLTNDLDLLPLASAHEEDVLLVQKHPRPQFLEYLHSWGTELPEIIALDDKGRIPESSNLRERKLGRLKPWGWSADTFSILSPLRQNAGEQCLDSIPWNPQVRDLYKKTWSAAFLKSLPWEHAFGDPAIVGESCHDATTLTELGSYWLKLGNTSVVKAAIGLAGRNMVRLRTEADFPLAHALLGAGHGVVLEPWLERICDFSAHYECEPHSAPRLKGFVSLHVDPLGRFLACSASANFSRLLPQQVARFTKEQGADWLHDLYATKIAQHLHTNLQGCGFQNWLGIDAFFYKDSDNHIRLKPVVEINPRCTMGRVTLDLLRFAPSGRTVCFRILHAKTAKAAGFADLAALAEHLLKKFPLQALASGKRTLIDSGLVLLNDPSTATAFLAVALFGRGKIDPDSLC